MILIILSFFSEKQIFAETFNEYYGRDYVFINSKGDYKKLKDFVKIHNKIFVKPSSSLQGIGVFPAIINSDEDFEKVWSRIVDLGDCIVDELVVNEESLAEFHPYSLNTLRVNTLLTKSGIKVLSVYLNLGNNKRYIDNYHTGAVGAAVDYDTGIVCTQGFDEYNKTYINHPYSNKQIVGYQLPNWNGFKELIDSIAVIVPEIRLVGWDITINSNGKWIVVEGNDNCGFSRYQAVAHTGLQSLLDEYIKDEKELFK